MALLPKYIVNAFVALSVLFLSLCWTSALDATDGTPNATTQGPSLVSTPAILQTALKNMSQGLVSNPGNLTTNETVPLTPPPPQKPPPALGLVCNSSSECKANFSSCVNNTCRCEAGYVQSKELLRCLKVITKLGDGCSEDEQCTVGLGKVVGPTTCLNFFCACDIGTSLIDDKCQGPRVLGTSCSSDDDCPIMKSYCGDGFCQCYDNYVPSSENNICLPGNPHLLLKMSGAPSSGCTEDIQCQGILGDQAICVVGDAGGVCECIPGTHLVISHCIPYKDLGDECSRDEECVSKNSNTESPSSRICNQSVCKCNTGWIQEDNVCKGGASQNTLAGALLSTLSLLWLAQRLLG